ncbi:thiolase-like protein [Pelagophyceae sp. CCMP2097]|nr:thiolase-like protein [Pelagophyceae sp. CCMP2097]
MHVRRRVDLRRVVVSGLGCVSPLAVGAEATWRRLLAGGSGVGRVSDFDVSGLPVRIAAQCAPDVGGDQRQSRFVALAVLAAKEAVIDAGAGLQSGPRAGVSVGSGIGSLDDAVNGAALVASGKRVSPFFVPRMLANMAAAGVSMAHDLQGPFLAPATACAAGAHAIGDAFRIIERGDADVMLAGASEASVNALALHGFARLRALTTSYNDRPAEASRPFDARRDGFVLGEGAAVLVLESYESALARGASVYAEVSGYGASADAFHITAPRPDGASAARAITAAVADAGLRANDVGYVNAHAASTPAGDAAEAAAIHRALAPRHSPLLVSSTKGATGHLLGAAGALEALLTVLALRDGTVPHTLNLEAPLDAPADLDFVMGAPRAAPDLRHAVSTSFGFGGARPLERPGGPRSEALVGPEALAPCRAASLGTNAALLFSLPPEGLRSRQGERP